MNPAPSKPARSLQKKIWRRLRERLSRAARRLDEDSLKIHSPAVESVSVCRQYYPSMRAGPPNPGPRSAATRAGMKSGPARIRGVSIVVPTCTPAKLRAAGTDFCGKLQPARNRFSFCGPPECNGGPAGGTSRRKIVRIYSRPEHAALVGACPTNSCEVVRVTGTLKKRFLHTRRPLNTSQLRFRSMHSPA